LSRMKQRGIPTLGERMTSLMEASGLNASELSARTDISVSYLSRIIQGEVVNPTIDFVMRIAAGLGVTENELLREDEGDKYAGGKEPGGVQPALRQQTQKTSSPRTLYDSPLSPSPQIILMRRLAVLEKKLATAEKNLHDAKEELRGLRALAADMQNPE
jgi:transcriptional regulator with XRE-family HTH domain